MQTVMPQVMPAYTYEEALKDQKWLAENSLEFQDKYRGEWVAIYFKQIVAHGKDFSKVIATANEMGITPAYTEFPAEDVIIYAIN